MSIQGNIDKAISVATGLYTQTPTFKKLKELKTLPEPQTATIDKANNKALSQISSKIKQKEDLEKKLLKGKKL